MLASMAPGSVLSAFLASPQLVIRTIYWNGWHTSLFSTGCNLRHSDNSPTVSCKVTVQGQVDQIPKATMLHGHCGRMHPQKNTTTWVTKRGEYILKYAETKSQKVPASAELKSLRNNNMLLLHSPLAQGPSSCYSCRPLGDPRPTEASGYNTKDTEVYLPLFVTCIIKDHILN